MSIYIPVDPNCITGRKLERALALPTNSISPSSSAPLLPKPNRNGHESKQAAGLGGKSSGYDTTLTYLPAFFESVYLRHTATNLKEPKVSPEVNCPRAWS